MTESPLPAGVQIRPTVLEDAAGIVAHMKRIAAEPDNGITRNVDEVRTIDEEQTQIQLYALRDNAMQIVAVTTANAVIGLANCSGGQRHSMQHSGGIGITVDREWRNQRIGTAMMQYLMTWAQNTGIIRRMELEVFTHNARAIHVYQKLGFVIEGTKHQAYLRDGRYVDSYLMAYLIVVD